MTFCTKSFTLFCVVAAATSAASGSSASAGMEPRVVGPARETAIGVAGKVAIVVSLGVKPRGPFSIRGAISDSGVARAEKTLSGKRVRLTLSLRGKNGKLTVLMTQTCGSSTSTWRLLAGTETYSGFSGNGTGQGRLVCGNRAAYRAVLTGRLQSPPPGPLAKPGAYSGTRFERNLRATLEVSREGRIVTNVSFRTIIARCQPPSIRFLEPRFRGNYAIGADSSFSIASEGYLVTGKFRRGAVVGTVSFDADGCKTEPVSWQATSDLALVPPVLAGRYCGFTLRGPGICLDVTSDGWVANARVGANFTCFAPSAATFTFGYTYPGLIAIRPDLTFAISVDVPLDDGGSIGWKLEGKFDEEGQVTGSGGFTRVTLVRDGTRYQCRNAISGFSAKRGA